MRIDVLYMESAIMPEFFSLNKDDLTYTVNGAAAMKVGLYRFSIKLTNAFGFSSMYDLKI